MELRTTEQQVNEMLILYESLRRSDHWNTNNNSNDSSNTTTTTTTLAALELPDKHPSLELLAKDETQFMSFVNEQEVLTALESLYGQFPILEPRMEKFRQRLADKDPITQTPRYGEKTAERVKHLLSLYQALKQVTWAAFGLPLQVVEDNDINSNNNNMPAVDSSDNSVVANLKSTVQAQQEAARLAELQAQQQRQEEEAQQRAQEERQRQQQEAQRQEAEEVRRQEEAELARRAEAVRQAQRQAQEAAAQAQRDWMDSIPKGPEGVREQIQNIKQDTAHDPEAQKTALAALLTLFTQIAQHPEEINFRRIRRDHPKFHQDIGRHKGGTEILIAAGFRLVTLDDVPCFFSKEPDLESDMDGWSAWFDNLKAILEVVKQMQ